MVDLGDLLGPKPLQIDKKGLGFFFISPKLFVNDVVSFHFFSHVSFVIFFVDHKDPAQAFFCPPTALYVCGVGRSTGDKVKSVNSSFRHLSDSEVARAFKKWSDQEVCVVIPQCV